MDGITMDGRTYRVRVKFNSRARSFRIPDGPNAGEMLSGRRERDIGGTFYDYAMSVEPNPQYLAEYDSFFEAISAPVPSHSITMPYGQSTITFDAMVTEGGDTDKGHMAGWQRWGGLTVFFESIRPVRYPE